jgi:hypothetical protein
MNSQLAPIASNPWPERRTELREREWRIYTN